MPAAGIERRLDVQAGPLLPAGYHVLPIGMSRAAPDENARQKLTPGRLPTLLSDRHRLLSQANFRPLDGGQLQKLRQRSRQGRLCVQVDYLQRQTGIASHGVVQAGHRVELFFPGQDQGLAALGELHLGTQHVLFQRHASLAPRRRVVQGRLGPADGILLHSPGRPRQKDIHVSGGNIEPHGLVGPSQLELGDAFARLGLAVTAAGPPEVVQGPLQRDFGFRIAAGTERARQDKSRGAGFAGRQSGRGHAKLSQKINLR